MGYDLKPRNKELDWFHMGAFSWPWMLEQGVGLIIGTGRSKDPGSYRFMPDKQGRDPNYNDGRENIIRKKSQGKIRYDKLKNNRQCVKCEKGLRKKEDGPYCHKCNVKRSNYRRKIRSKRIKAGFCAECGKHKIIRRRKFCKICLLKDIAFRHTGSKKNWVALLDMLKKQKYRCIYSGQKLRIGYNASIDHRIPKYRGGTNELSNLQWTTISVNALKGALPEKKFLYLIRKISHYIDAKRK